MMKKLMALLILALLSAPIIADDPNTLGIGENAKTKCKNKKSKREVASDDSTSSDEIKEKEKKSSKTSVEL